MTTIALEPISFTVPAMLDGLIRGLRTLHSRRARRHALTPLLGMDQRMLDDMGLSPADVRDAIAATGSAGRTLHNRRRTNALSWSPRVAAA